jgi:hypothetical protein
VGQPVLLFNQTAAGSAELGRDIDGEKFAETARHLL